MHHTSSPPKKEEEKSWFTHDIHRLRHRYTPVKESLPYHQYNTTKRVLNTISGGYGGRTLDVAFEEIIYTEMTYFVKDLNLRVFVKHLGESRVSNNCFTMDSYSFDLHRVEDNGYRTDFIWHDLYMQSCVRKFAHDEHIHRILTPSFPDRVFRVLESVSHSDGLKELRIVIDAFYVPEHERPSDYR